MPMVNCAAVQIASLNVRGLRQRRRQYQLLQLFQRDGITIAAVQETKLSTDEDTQAALNAFLPEYSVCVSHSVGLSGGCMLFISKNLNATILASKVDDAGRFVCCDVVISGVEWRIICLYAPNRLNERRIFFLSLAQFLRTDRSIILMGDFNCVCSEEDRSTGNRRYDSSAAVLSDLISEYGLVDIGSTKGSTVHFTHFNPFSSARLDRIYISAVKCSIVRDYVVRPIFFTDHCMVSVRVGPRGWRAPPIPWELWKLNNSILSDELFQHSVAACLKETFALSRLTVFQKWDLFKQEVKNLAVEA